MPPRKGKSPAHEPEEEAEVSGIVEVVDEPEKEQSPERKVSEDIDDKPPVISLSDLVSAMKSFREPSVKAEKAAELRKPETFTGKDSKKLKAFLFQCRLYFRSSPFYDDDFNKVTFALSHLSDTAQQWFEPGVSDETVEPPDWLTDWDLFVQQLQDNFGPTNETADLEHDLSNLYMRENQRISDYLVRFNSIAVRLQWGEAALRFRFYEGLPDRIKDEIMKGDGKPSTLVGLREKAKNIDARYWERHNERTREQKKAQRNQPNKPSSSSTGSANTPSSSAPKWTPKSQNNQSQSSDKKSPKNSDKSKDSKPKVDLTGKLDSRGKLTQQERQHRIDKNLCLYCGKSDHRAPDCLSKASSAKGRASTASSDAPAKSGSEKKKD